MSCSLSPEITLSLTELQFKPGDHLEPMDELSLSLEITLNLAELQFKPGDHLEPE